MRSMAYFALYKYNMRLVYNASKVNACSIYSENQSQKNYASIRSTLKGNPIVVRHKSYPMRKTSFVYLTRISKRLRVEFIP